MSAPTNGPITVNEERVKNLLYEMKDQLLEDLDKKLEKLDDKFEKKADLFMLTEARKQIDRHAERIASLERWRSYVLGIAGVAVLSSGGAVTFLAVYLTN